MKIKIFITILFITLLNSVIAQNYQFYIPDYVQFRVDSLLQKKIYKALDKLFEDINSDIEESKLVDKSNYNLNVEFFIDLKGLELSKKYNNPNFYKKQLINAYEILPNQYLLEMAFIGYANNYPIINRICSIIAYNKKGKITFLSPLMYRTKNWEKKQIGNILYYYKTDLNISEAEKFNKLTINIAKNLELEPLQLVFYKCDNFQEVFKIIGFDYDLIYNGKSKESWILDNTIFQGFNNEQFSHDIFHVYTSKMIDRKDRNWTAEEGIAYSWGDAYYPKSNGKIITRDELVYILKDYLNKKPNTNLLSLFEKRSSLFNELSPNVKVKSVLSSLICDEVQKEKGNEGIIELIKCGKGDDNFFKTTDELIQLNRLNFNEEVKKMIDKFE